MPNAARLLFVALLLTTLLATSADALRLTRSDGVFTADTQTLTNKTLTAPVLSGTVTGTYTLGGTPTIASPTVTGIIGSYNSNTAANTGVPYQVGAANLTGQTAAINATTLFTPGASGLYFITYYMVVTGTGTSTNLTLNLLSTDDAAARTVTTTISCAATNTTSSSNVIRSTATAIQYSTTMTGTCTYALFISLMRLS